MSTQGLDEIDGRLRTECIRRVDENSYLFLFHAQQVDARLPVALLLDRLEPYDR